jgi:exodeoxyribonuclease VII small subunit
MPKAVAKKHTELNPMTDTSLTEPLTLSKQALPLNFEAGLSELAALVDTMEAGDAPLAHMLSSYQRGTQLLKFCESQLKAAEQQLLQLDSQHELVSLNLI